MIEAAWYGIPIKYIALPTMSIQNAAAALIMHYSRVMPGYSEKRYFSSTAVLLSEILKLAICLVICRKDHLQSYQVDLSWTSTFRRLFPTDSWKLAIPAALYTLQNNLQYFAISNLDAATFQVTYQLKIITTAMFAVLLLRKRLSLSKWCSLALLTGGVALVSLPDGAKLGDDTFGGGHNMNAKSGFCAVLVACTLSGLAGVYFEKVLKDSENSLWTLNVQLSLFSLFPAFFLGVLLKDGYAIYEHGFFYGYNLVVWASIVVQAAGGLVVAMCVLYADNIMKNFATSIAVLISAIFSVFMFDFRITRNFLVGGSAVLLATYIYGLPESDTVHSMTSEFTIVSHVDTAEYDTEMQKPTTSSDIRKAAAVQEIPPSPRLRK